ncbi:MAG TPA: hypothetical protein VF490_21595 [Chryseosolibacter sp.]
MQSFIQLAVLTFCLVSLASYFLVIASKLWKLVKTSGNSDNLLLRILQLIKETAKAAK